jgi:uracil-DNA glycosylase family 4
MLAAMDSPIEKDRPSLRELLAFYAEAGVDDALTDEPVDRFVASETRPAAPARQAEPARASAPTPPRPTEPRMPAPAITTPVAVPDEGQIALARQHAATAATLDELRQHMAEFDGCNLKFTAKNLVFADGNPEADIMLVGEAPGRDEDLEGLPFVGRSGQLLDRMLAAIGLDRQSVYIANVIPWRPPGNRTPTPQETEICRPFIERQVELANPKILITLGGPSAKTLLRTTEGVMRLRGNWKAHVTPSGMTIPAMPTLHPAYLLRNPAHKKFAWRDFLEIKAKLRALA